MATPSYVDPNEDAIQSTAQFLGGFYPSLLTAAGCLTGFLLIRSYFPDVYDAKKERVRIGGSKKQRADVADMPPKAPKTVWRWAQMLLSMKDGDIYRYVGPDALMFLRFLRMCFKAAMLMMIYGLVIILPVNMHGSNGLGQFERFSASNIGDGSSLLWAHFLGAYLFTYVILHLLYTETKMYVALRQEYMASPCVQSYSLVLRDIKKSVNRDDIRLYLKKLVGEEYVAIHIVEDPAPYEKLIAEKDNILFAMERVKTKVEKSGNNGLDGGSRPRRKEGFLGLVGKEIDALEYYEAKLKNVNESIQKLQKTERGFAHAAILTFDNIRTCTVFRNIPLQSHVRLMSVKAAPGRNDIIWANLGTPVVYRLIRSLIVVGAVFFLIFCYTIPVSFVASLANLPALAKTKGLEWLQPLVDFSPALTSLIQGYAPPLVYSLFFSLVPTFMLYLSRAQHMISESESQTSAIWKMYLFILFNSFLMMTFAGAVLSKLDMLQYYIGRPIEIANLLARTLPAQSTFFINLVMLTGLSVLPLEVLQAAPLVITKLKRWILAGSTWDHLQAMTFSSLGFHALYSYPLLIFLPMVSFAALAPLILIFSACFYAISYLIWLNQLLYVYNIPPSSGGSQFPVVFRCCIVSLLLAQALLMGIMGLKRQALCSSLMLPLIAFTAYYSNSFSKRMRQVGTLLSLENLLSTDRVEEMNPQTKALLQKAYDLHQDDGSGDEISHRRKQPLVEPYAVTTDGLLEELVQDDDMDLEDGTGGDDDEEDEEEVKIASDIENPPEEKEERGQAIKTTEEDGRFGKVMMKDMGGGMGSMMKKQRKGDDDTITTKEISSKEFMAKMQNVLTKEEEDLQAQMLKTVQESSIGGGGGTGETRVSSKK